jgi:hypothetical protein
MLERSRRIAGRGRKIGHPLNSTDEGSAGRGRRTGYGVGKIVVSIWRMIDTVLALRPVRLSKPQICATNRSWRGRIIWPLLRLGNN